MRPRVVLIAINNCKYARGRQDNSRICKKKKKNDDNNNNRIEKLEKMEGGGGKGKVKGETEGKHQQKR